MLFHFCVPAGIVKLQGSDIADDLPTLCQRQGGGDHRGIGDAVPQDGVDGKVAVTVLESRAIQRWSMPPRSIDAMARGTVIAKDVCSSVIIIGSGVGLRTLPSTLNASRAKVSKPKPPAWRLICQRVVP